MLERPEKRRRVAEGVSAASPAFRLGTGAVDTGVVEGNARSGCAGAGAEAEEIRDAAPVPAPAAVAEDAAAAAPPRELALVVAAPVAEASGGSDLGAPQQVPASLLHRFTGLGDAADQANLRKLDEICVWLLTLSKPQLAGVLVSSPALRRVLAEGAATQAGMGAAALGGASAALCVAGNAIRSLHRIMPSSLASE